MRSASSTPMPVEHVYHVLRRSKNVALEQNLKHLHKLEKTPYFFISDVDLGGAQGTNRTLLGASGLRGLGNGFIKPMICLTPL